MASRPNFKHISRREEVVLVAGESGDPPEDVLEISILLRQGERVETARVARLGGASWEVGVPAAGFAPGPALLIGIEMRHENATTVTWTQTLDIPAS